MSETLVKKNSAIQKKPMEDSITASTRETLAELAGRITSGARVLFVTGAGLSVPSGIAAYRCESKSAQKTAIWSRFILEWGTMACFRRDPLVWYNEFWLQTHQRPEYDRAVPNEGHHAIANLSKLTNTRCITQNVDRLHRRTHLNYNRLIEVHGALGLYRCSSTLKCRRTGEQCPYVSDLPIEGITIDDLEPVEGTSYEEGNLRIKQTPKCPACGEHAVPLALLFDELYTSHTFFQWERALEWIEHCDVMIFVGTSLSVGVTTECMEIARGNGVAMYNFNIRMEREAKAIPDLNHVIGDSVVTIRSLYQHCLYRYYHPYRQVSMYKRKRMPQMKSEEGSDDYNGGGGGDNSGDEGGDVIKYEPPKRRMRLYYPPRRAVLKAVF